MSAFKIYIEFNHHQKYFGPGVKVCSNRSLRNATLTFLSQDSNYQRMSSLFLATSAPNPPLKLYHNQRDPFKMCQSISRLCLILRGGLHFIQNKSQSPCTSAVSRGPLNSSCHLSRLLISTHTGFSIQKKNMSGFLLHQDFCSSCSLCPK